MEVANDEALDEIVPKVVEVAENNQYYLTITKCYTPSVVDSPEEVNALPISVSIDSLNISKTYRITVPVVEIALFRVSEGH